MSKQQPGLTVAQALAHALRYSADDGLLALVPHLDRALVNDQLKPEQAAALKQQLHHRLAHGRPARPAFRVLPKSWRITGGDTPTSIPDRSKAALLARLRAKENA